MSKLSEHLSGYIALRRSLGAVLKEGDYLLPSLVRYLEANGAEHVRTELALAWATSAPGVLPVTKRQRLTAARGFAKYLAAFDQENEVPPADLLPSRYSRVVPYIYSEQDISALMCSAQCLQPRFRAHTYETFVGLLAVSGLRMGEAARLEVTDIDHDRSVLVVRGSKLENGREVPLHPTALAALAAYAAERHRFPTARPNSSFFISGAGTPLYLRCIDHTFGLLVRAAGLHGRGARGSPRLHDLRHSFAVKTLLTWHRDGIDVDAAMPLLSKILGHASPASTYWYLQAVPELFAVLEDRLGRAFEGLP